MRPLLPVLFLVLAGGVVAATSKQHSACEQPRDSLGVLGKLPEDVLGEIVTMMFGRKMASLARDRDMKLFLRELFRLPALLAYLTRWDGLGATPLGPKLLEMFQMAKVMRDRLYLAFDEGMEVVPNLPVIIDYINATVLHDSSKSFSVRLTYCRNIVWLLCKHGECTALQHFIESNGDSMTSSLNVNGRKWRHFINELPRKSVSVAMKIYPSLSDSLKAVILVSIFLTRISETELPAALALLSLPHETGFVNEVLNRMQHMTAHKNASYFLHGKELARNNSALLRRLAMKGWNNTIARRAAYTRLLYSIRLGWSLEWDCDVRTDNSKLVQDIEMRLGLLQELDETSKRVLALQLLRTVLHVQDRELFARFLPYLSRMNKHDKHEILFSSDIKLITFPEFKRLIAFRDLSLDSFLRAMRICKDMTGFYFENEWIINRNGWGTSSRLTVFAEVGDAVRFQAEMQTLGDDKFTVLKNAMCNIVRHVENPVPFVDIILKAGYCQEYNDIFNSIRFLRPLLLESHDESVFVALREYRITPGNDFFEALLDERALANAFRDRLAMRMREQISISLPRLYYECTTKIMALLEILQVPVRVSQDAFRLNGDSGEHDDRLKNLKSVHTLAELDIRAREPGFLAVLALLYSSQDIFYSRFGSPRKVVRLANPLILRVLDLLRLWRAYDRDNFIACADWRTVVIFFGANPYGGSLRTALMVGMYPVTLKSVIEVLCRRQKVTFEFISECAMNVFIEEVLPMIESTASAVGCTIKCRVVKQGMVQKLRDSTRNLILRILGS